MPHLKGIAFESDENTTRETARASAPDDRQGIDCIPKDGSQPECAEGRRHARSVESAAAGRTGGVAEASIRVRLRANRAFLQGSYIADLTRNCTRGQLSSVTSFLS